MVAEAIPLTALFCVCSKYRIRFKYYKTGKSEIREVLTRIHIISIVKAGSKTTLGRSWNDLMTTALSPELRVFELVETPAKTNSFASLDL